MVICQSAAVLPKYSPFCQNRKFTAAELANLPTVAISLVDHSCEGRNLTVLCLQQSARIRRFAAKIDAALPPVKNRFLPTQEWSPG